MSILPSHRQGLYLLEQCRVMVKDEKLTYVRQEDAYQKFWSFCRWGWITALHGFTE